ncbi:cobalamin biosynthesis protein CobW [Saccharothrix sp. ALI-22-I]|uniref:GTP-binding protein n=1 Tax=Saccharothrix sp. ALI-22-I TaxID=1933778 RepID=UPI00097CC031|nr:GTP-binding protein [Saccharothrix sp. ALI-22-I]ONI91563.1 cobalamin biosynthesis protein CobW [Saccharothrix sp. ALI-22-I]
METSVILVAGLGEHVVAEEVWRALPGSVLVRHDLSGLAEGVVRRWVDGMLTELRLEHGCVSCTMRLDLLPLLRQLDGPVVVHLDPALEPEAVCFALMDEPIRVEAVITVVDRATWLTDATGGDLLAERGLGAAPGDDRTAAQLVVGQTEFADALVLTGPPDERVSAVLDRLNPTAARQELAHLDVAALLAVIPADARRGEVDDTFGLVLHGQPPSESAHGVHLVHFTARRAFHPARLHRALTALCQGVVRVRGRVWLASRHDTVMWLEAAGRSLRIGEAGPWLAAVDDWSEVDELWRAAAAAIWDLDIGDRAQELVVVSHRSSPEVITSALREALLTDEELALAAELRFADPFPGSREKLT